MLLFGRTVAATRCSDLRWSRCDFPLSALLLWWTEDSPDKIIAAGQSVALFRWGVLDLMWQDLNMWRKYGKFNFTWHSPCPVIIVQTAYRIGNASCVLVWNKELLKSVELLSSYDVVHHLISRVLIPFPESGEDSRKVASCCSMQECTFRVECIFYGECLILTQNEKAFCGVLECACNCQIKMYQVSNLSNFSPRLHLIPFICLPFSFAFLCESLFFF